MRRGFKAAAVAAAACLALLGGASSATAAEDHFCNVVVPAGYQCSVNTYVLNWREGRVRYPGHQAHNVIACAAIWNHATDQWRGGLWICDYTFTNPYVKYNAVRFGPTSGNTYRPYNISQSFDAHTLTGWATTN